MIKTYQSKHAYHSFTFYNKDGSKGEAINFTVKPKGHGEFTTKNPEVMKFLEASDAFRTGKIRVKWTKVQKAMDVVKKAEDALALAKKNLDEAKEDLKAVEKAERAGGAEAAPKKAEKDLESAKK